MKDSGARCARQSTTYILTRYTEFTRFTQSEPSRSDVVLAISSPRRDQDDLGVLLVALGVLARHLWCIGREGF